MINWVYNKNVNMDLPEATLEAFDKFIDESFIKVFIPKDCIKDMRNKFKEDFKLEENERERER